MAEVLADLGGDLRVDRWDFSLREVVRKRRRWGGSFGDVGFGSDRVDFTCFPSLGVRWGQNSDPHFRDLRPSWSPNSFPEAGDELSYVNA
jgi:hypothetical protein